MLLHERNDEKRTRIPRKFIRKPGPFCRTFHCDNRVSYPCVSSGETKNIQLLFRSTGIAGASSPLVGFQFFASSRSCSMILVISGRTDSESADSNSSSHVCISNAHSASENPTMGRSGRIPRRTLWMTATSGLVCSKGLRPVTTYRGRLMLCEGNRRVVGLYTPQGLSSQGHICPCSLKAASSEHVWCIHIFRGLESPVPSTE